MQAYKYVLLIFLGLCILLNINALFTLKAAFDMLPTMTDIQSNTGDPAKDLLSTLVLTMVLPGIDAAVFTAIILPQLIVIFVTFIIGLILLLVIIFKH